MNFEDIEVGMTVWRYGYGNMVPHTVLKKTAKQFVVTGRYGGKDVERPDEARRYFATVRECLLNEAALHRAAAARHRERASFDDVRASELEAEAAKETN